jgi:hypothetical protein
MNEQTRECRMCGQELPLTKAYFAVSQTSKGGFTLDCKVCKGLAKSYGEHHKRAPKASQEGYKVCNTCLQELPATTEYFNKTKDRLTPKCKLCSGNATQYGRMQDRTAANRASPTKTCNRCKRELPRHSDYFFRQESHPDSFVYSCKECMGSEFGSHRKVLRSEREGWKICTKCGLEMEANIVNFVPSELGLYGLSAKCRQCYYEYERAKREDPNQIEELREYYRERSRRPEAQQRAKERYEHQKHTPEYQEKLRSYRVVYDQRPEVKERRRLQARERLLNPEKREGILAAQQRYYIRRKHDPAYRESKRRKNRNYMNSERGKTSRSAVFSRRRARLRGLPHDFTAQDWRNALAYFDGKCAICGASEDLWTAIVQDHWIPVKHNGGTTKANIIPICHAKPGFSFERVCCNLSKGAKLPHEWLLEQFGEERAAEILQTINAYFDWAKAQGGE